MAVTTRIKAAKYVPGVWITAEGREIPYESLADDHLVNILKMLRRNAEIRRAIRSVNMLRYITPLTGDAAEMAIEHESEMIMRDPWTKHASKHAIPLIALAMRRGITIEWKPEIAGRQRREPCVDCGGSGLSQRGRDATRHLSTSDDYNLPLFELEHEFNPCPTCRGRG